MVKEGRMTDQICTNEEIKYNDLDLLVEDEYSLAWRTFYYLKRHPEILEKNRTAYVVTELIQIAHMIEKDCTIEKAKEVVNFIADLYNKYPHSDQEFIPTEKQLEHFNHFPVATETLQQYVNSLFQPNSDSDEIIGKE